jgi:hypothetical protein
VTPNEELKILREELLDESIDGERITIIDKNGKPRKYKIKDYAELVIMDNAMKAQSNATINVAIEVESDLVQVSHHYTICDICKEIEGKVFSISGTDPDFPPFDFEFPPHNRCKHSITVVFKEMLEHFGLEKYK